MDNFTHTLVGLVLADVVALALPTPPSARVRGLLRLASAFTNNVPDLDFLYTSITPGKLGYLLHHRGHTHTLLAGVVLGALTYAALFWFARRRSFGLTRAEVKALAALSLFGPWAHIGMDALNNYGVHPFWPVHDGWFYGDTVFIVEPWFWVLSLPPLALSSVTRVGRILLGACLVVALGLVWVLPVVGWVGATLLTLAGALTIAVSHRLREKGALVGLAGLLAVILTFGTASRVARAALLDAIDASDASTTVVDAVLTPAPSVPLCWQALVVGRRGESYLLEAATVSTLPSLRAANECGFDDVGPSLGMGAPVRRSTRAVHFQRAHQVPLAELRRLARDHCHFAAFLRFARTPFWVDRKTSLYVGDLRYDRHADEGFSELALPARPANCPPWLPPWTPPRRDLLEAP